ncbi:hypothetical protein [Pseudoalteromonas arctica]|uniref:Big-1 domain-containing protein n=1 Tax=Pseudoalteromonas arctica A 37-1-2 TaxID=1117313 RepID=A0A290S5K7_9GAMM|nr:hypothetical protein [Pseudoalteromonas arctica]ATC86807.1 hypothetical protein PARC_a2306 [Pseudoalteromonas arctica A 37-1-2]
MPLMRLLSISLLSFFLTACGGGGSLEKDGSIGDGDSTTEASTYSVSLKGYSQVDATESNSVTAATSLDLRATLTQDGEIVAGKRITFTLADEVGELSPSSALTQNDGIATVELTAGADAGAGEVTATYTVDGESYSSTFDFQSSGGQGGDTGVSGAVNLQLMVLDSSGNTFSDINPVSKDNKGIVTATLLDGGIPFTSQLITFTTNFTGRITPELGTALTNESGQAVVSLSSGDFKGAGELIATYISDTETITKTIGFFSSGDDASIDDAVANVDIKLLKNCQNNWDANRNTTSLEQSYLAFGCEVVNQFSSDDLIDILVKVTDTSSGDGFVGVIADISTDLGSLLPVSGKALTDNFGFAILKLQPGANSGAGEITATSKSTSNQKAFEISTAELQVKIKNGLFNKLDDNGNIIAGEYQPLAAGATTVITVEILDSNSLPVVTAFDVEFTSNCTQAGLSIMDATAKSISGIATATYRTDGCSASLDDTVTATVLTGGTPVIKSINIPVSIAKVESIEFIDATQNVIALKGTGGQTRSETSEITFKLKDKIGKSVVSSRMDFRLSATNGGISLSHGSVFTDAEGLARVQINAGFVPMAVRVQACYIPDDQIPENQNDDVTCWQDVYLECQKDAAARNNNVSCPAGELSLVSLDGQVITVSDLVSISSGLPDGNSFTASAQTINIEALDYIGDTNEISVYLADHFNNPVPDGTAVYLTTEGGAVGTLDGTAFNAQLECNTVDGACNAQWRNQNPKPFTEAKWGNGIEKNCDLYFGNAAPCINGILSAADNVDNGVPLGGRVTVLVTAKGQESFIDINGNGRFDTNEFYSGYDLPEAFVDHNENGVYDGLAGTYNPVTAEVKPPEFCQEGSPTDPCSPENTNGGHFEENFDIDLNGMHTLADGKYNGLLCTEAATNPPVGATFASLCTKDLIDVRDSFQIILSGSAVYSRFVVTKQELTNKFPNASTANVESCSDIRSVATNDAGISTETLILRLEPSDTDDFCDVSLIDISSSVGSNSLDSLTFGIYYSDRYNNPIPSGTDVSVSTKNGKYDGRNSFTMLESNSTVAFYEEFTISRETDPNDANTGLLSVTFETPKGVQTPATITIRDDG